MSCYEWEAGTIQLPKAQFAKIRKQFINDYNDIVQREMNAANNLREKLFVKYKGKRGINWFDAIYTPSETYGISYQTVCKMVPDEKKKPIKLTKKVMEFANSKTTRFPLGDEGCLTFNLEDKTVSYSVPENNHAVEHARGSQTGKLFFRTLNNIKWTRGSGGCLYGNDEYNTHESYGSGGGGNYVTQTFGNQKEKARWKY